MFDFTMFIRYEDRYVRTPDGWRIAERDVRTQWTTRVPVADVPQISSRS